MLGYIFKWNIVDEFGIYIYTAYMYTYVYIYTVYIDIDMGMQWDIMG
jgi:hypothetical protein